MSAPVVKALVFDVFGTVVDWRSSIVRDLAAWGATQGLALDWTELADRWRGQYLPQMNRVRSGAIPWANLDILHEAALSDILAEMAAPELSRAHIAHMNQVWHRLAPWPDSVAGLTRLKARYIISPLSNGNVALLTNMAKHAGLPWDLVLSAELFRHYKPDPEVYTGACALLGLEPAQVMMCAAHNGDLAAARACGLKTAFIPRVTEYGATQTRDLEATEAWDVIADDFLDLAARLGA